MNEQLKRTIDIRKFELSQIFQRESEGNYKYFDEKEIALGNLLVDLAYETELHTFEEFGKVTSTDNTTVKSKFEKLYEKETSLRGYFIPQYLVMHHPLDYDVKTLETAPWVNMIHAWVKTLNLMNSVNRMQKENDISAEELFVITHELFKMTTDYNDETHLRGDVHFVEQTKYPETRMRESGTKGVNPQRHICFEEMKYILDMIKVCYPVQAI